MAESFSLSNGDLRSASALSTSTSSNNTPQPPIPSEVKATLSRLSAYRNVRGVMILSRRPVTGGQRGIVQSSGAVFEGEGGRRYAQALEGVVDGVARAVGECDEGVRNSVLSSSFVPARQGCTAAHE